MSKKRKSEGNHVREFVGFDEYDEYEPTSEQKENSKFYAREKGVINYHVQLPMIGEVKNFLTLKRLNADEIEEAILESGEDGTLYLPNVVLAFEDDRMEDTGSVVYRKYKIVRCEGGQRGIVDFIAYNKKNWFPVEVKSQFTFGNPEDITIGFRNWRQLKALKLESKVKPLTEVAKKAISEPGCVRLPGIVLVRYGTHERKSGDVLQHIGVFSVFS